MGQLLYRSACTCGGTCEHCRAAESNAAPAIVREALISPGRPIDQVTRAFMESRFGRDFSRVRVHVDARASESTRAVNALAYTVGHDVVFGAGRYSPETGAGRELLAHELAHVVQQEGMPGDASKPLRVAEAHGIHEAEADTIVQAVMRGRALPRVSGAPAHPEVRRRVPPPQAAVAGQGPPPIRVADAIARLEQAMALATDPNPDLYVALEIVIEISEWLQRIASEREVRRQFGVGLGHGPRVGALDPAFTGDTAALIVSFAQGAVTSLQRDIRLGSGRSKGHWNQAISRVKAAQKHLEILTQERVSFELEEAMQLPDVPTQLATISPAEMHVLSWLRMHQTAFADAERERGITRHAIAGVIAWEALENIRSQSIRAVGPGKVHATTFFGTSAAEQVEESGAIRNPGQDEREKEAWRERQLATAPGAIRYISAIMQALADIALTHGFSIHCDAPMLAHIYNSRDLPGWEHELQKRTAAGPLSLGDSPIGTWVRDHRGYLEEAVNEPACRPKVQGGQEQPAVIQRKSPPDVNIVESGRTFPLLQRQVDLQLEVPALQTPRPGRASLVSPSAMRLSAPLAEIARVLLDEVVRVAESGSTVLRADDVQTALDNRGREPMLLQAFNDAVFSLDTIGGGRDVPRQFITVKARELMDVLEFLFIHDPKASSLDLLPPEQRRRYRGIQWNPADFPGGPTGSHEAAARQMARDLGRTRPERRANVGETALLPEKQFTSSMERYIRSEMREIPGQKGFHLNQYALESFIRMREDAGRDGIELVVISRDRPAARSRAMAGTSQNPAAVARFSSHNLGLAIDVRLSHDGQRYREATTQPMQNVVDMRESPVHKWLFLRGANYGWYPYHNEPWHWEYNPPGFREQFFHYGDYPLPSTTEETA